MKYFTHFDNYVNKKRLKIKYLDNIMQVFDLTKKIIQIIFPTSMDGCL